MFTQPPNRSYWLTVLLMFSMFSSGLLPLSTTAAQERRRKPIVVSFGQPNIWSLEQAHYLLARMHMLNLDLQAKTLTSTELDPNATHGTRIQILKQLLQIGAEFDQGAGFQNRRMVENAKFNDSRRRELITHRSAMRDRALELTGEISDLEIEKARLDADPSATDAQKALKDAEIKSKNKELAQVKELITQDTEELGTTTAQATSTPVDPNALPSPTQLPTSVLDKLVEKNAQDLLAAARDPKLNATTMLDNTIQLQYEIVAKQLTLLRDEVGPGERLVFLELPQSIYSTPGDGDEKMAQSWWHVNGYTRTDPLLRLLLELLEIEMRWDKIKQVKAYRDRSTQVNAHDCNLSLEKETDSMLRLFKGLKCEHDIARKAVLTNIYREANSLFARAEQNGARDTSEQIELIRKMIALKKLSADKDKKDKDKDEIKALSQVDARSFGSEKVSDSPSRAIEVERRQQIDDLKKRLLMVLSREDPLSKPKDEDPRDDKFKEFLDEWKKFDDFRKQLEADKSIGFEKAMEFIRLDENLAINKEGAFDVSSLPRRTVRTVDIIPRQSSLNVNDIQETVKQTGILAGFKFLFGFAGTVNFQRQREQFEQFLHQELYASGFGKGSRDFGWTFGATPGTKRVAPGVRTTYAALIVPDDAESVVVSARGCYFPRKSYQPLDFQDTGHADWDREQRYRRYNCGDEENYVLTIPGGGDVSNFWVTNIDYEDGRQDGDFTTVSVRGNNFSSQMGVLVDGVPLFPTIGLAQMHLMPRKAGANGTEPAALASDCDGEGDDKICGRFERVDSQQIVFSFKMPTSYLGTPTITLIAPGKSVDLNSLRNVRIRGQANQTLHNESSPFMFGRRPEMQLLNFTPGTARVSGILTGGGFAATDGLYINGVEITGTQKQFKSATLYQFEFDLNADEVVKLVLVRNNDILNKSIPNPAALKIKTARSTYVPPANNQPGVLTITLDGTGFAPNLGLQVTGGQQPQLTYVSTEQVRVRVISPTAPSAAAPVSITLTNNATHGRVTWVIASVP
jgi:hypothetical protein